MKKKEGSGGGLGYMKGGSRPKGEPLISLSRDNEKVLELARDLYIVKG